MSSQPDTQKTKNDELQPLVARQSQQIEKLEADLSMIYQLELGLAKNSQSWESRPKLSIGSARVAVKEEETVQQIYEDQANGNTALELSLKADIKQEALGGHVFF